MAYRILHVLPWITSGGVEQRRLRLIQHLDPDMFEQRVICKEMRGAVADRMAETGVQIDVVPGTWAPFDLDSIAAILELIATWKPDVIHGAVFEGVNMASLAGYLGQVPHVIVEETGATTWRSWKGDLLMAFSAMLAEKCVAISPHVFRYLQKRSCISDEKLQLITNGITLEPSPPPSEVAAYRQELGIPANALVVGSMSRIYDRFKRFSDLMRAFALLDPDDYDVPLYLLVAGKGPDLDMLKEMAHELGVSERVVFTGYIREPYRLYPVLDIFSLPSTSEAFGLVVVEAMGAGIPVVTSDAGAFPDIVDHGKTGLLTPTKNPPELAKALHRLLSNADERKALGQAAQQMAKTAFSTERYLSDVEAFYLSILED